MRQVYQQRLFPEANPNPQGVQNGQAEACNNSQNQDENAPNTAASEGPTRFPDGAGAETATLEPRSEEEDDKNDSEDRSSQIAAASMWTRKDLKEFKETVRAEGGEAIIRVGQGESVTVSFNSGEFEAEG